LIAGTPHEGVRLIGLVLAALAAGIASSLAAGDYVSGTAPLAVTSGLCLYGLLAVRLGGSAPDALQPDALVFVSEVSYGLVVVLAGYVAAWRADLAWVLPRRVGRPYVPKRVGPAELLLRNLPALALTSAIAAGLWLLGGHKLSPGWPACSGWLACCAAGAAAGHALFRVRSTFFLWTAPGIAVLSASLAGPQALDSWCHLPAGGLVAIGGFGAVLGYLGIASSAGRS
jgi:hypothetical protein